MTERQFSEVEWVLFAIDDAAARTKRAIAAVAADDAEQYVLHALSSTHENLSRAYGELSQGTYYAIQPAVDPARTTKRLQSAG